MAGDADSFEPDPILTDVTGGFDSATIVGTGGPDVQGPIILRYHPTILISIIVDARVLFEEESASSQLGPTSKKKKMLQRQRNRGEAMGAMTRIGRCKYEKDETKVSYKN